jgi:hemerythrin
MALIEKRELPLVGYQGMNLVHERELDYLNSLYDAVVEGRSSEEIDRLFEEFLMDVREHFAYEEDLMRKSHFFAYECHSGEHRRVLEELEAVRKRWQEERDREFLKKYFEETFKPWITEHILTMDTVTAQWLNRVMAGFTY